MTRTRLWRLEGFDSAGTPATQTVSAESRESAAKIAKDSGITLTALIDIEQEATEKLRHTISHSKKNREERIGPPRLCPKCGEPVDRPDTKQNTDCTTSLWIDPISNFAYPLPPGQCPHCEK